MRRLLLTSALLVAGCSSAVPAPPTGREADADFPGANAVLVAEAAGEMDAVAAALTADGWFVAQQSAQSLATDWRNLSSARVRLSVARVPDGRLVVRGERGADEASAGAVVSRGPLPAIVQDANREWTLHAGSREAWDALVRAARSLGGAVTFARR